MEMKLVALVMMTSLVAIVTSAPAPAAKKWIDLSHTLLNTTIHWPGITSFRLMSRLKLQTKDYYLEANDIYTAEHMGTHMDAPRHFIPNAMTLDKIPLDMVIGDAIVVNMSAKAAKNRDAMLMTSDLEAWERENGRIPDDVILLLYTGWGKYWGDAQGYLGTTTNNWTLLHYPGMHPDAAQWLVDNRKIKMYGVDAISLDGGIETKFRVHTILLGRNIPGLENVANLDKLPAKGATVYAAPMKIGQGSGGPCRVLATINKPQTYSGGTTAGSYKVIVYLFVSMATIFALLI